MFNTGQPELFEQHLFLSDVHLGAFKPKVNAELEKQLIKLVDYCESNKILIHILGDLFDYWMEYPKLNFVPSLGQKLLARFESYNKKVHPVLYLTGNHDHWTYGYFDKLNFRVCKSHHIITLQEKNVLLLHGDGLPDFSPPLKQPLLNRVLKNPGFIQLYQTLLPPEQGLWLMKKFSAFSRSKETFEPEILNNWAKRALETNKKINVILSGHDHIPRQETFNGGRYINTGAFYKNKTVVLYKNNQYRIVNWNTRLKQFIDL